MWKQYYTLSVGFVGIGVIEMWLERLAEVLSVPITCI